MRISTQWLQEWVMPNLGAEELAEQLTMAGLEVDSIDMAAPEFTGVVVGKVLSIARHPDADKLQVCTVTIGRDEPLQIVCGARNVRTGMRVPTALVGATLPGDFKIKKSRLRGVDSLGMLCSEKELGIAETSEGLMELPEDAAVGMNVREYLGLDDNIIEVDLTPNRGDCLSMAGIAREVATLNRIPLKSQAIATVQAATQDRLRVSLENPEQCPRYLGRVIRGVNPQAKSPFWMRERLRRAGLRSISPLVDITNYVLLERGHPMHAFDLDKLQGGIVVRCGRTREKLRLLDGKEVELDEEMLVISDEQKALALAGIMGGEESAVTDGTRDVFLECAFFTPLALAGKARRLGLQTDSSYRFERGVDPEGLSLAMERATQLVLEICGGNAGPVEMSQSEAHLPTREPISLRRKRITDVLGCTLEDTEVADILQRLGMDVQAAEAGWSVRPPSHRFDIGLEVDLIEELARVYGYNRLPTKAYQGDFVMRPAPETRIQKSRIQDLLYARDYQEVITYSFVDPALQALLDPEHAPIALSNPISADMAVMRTSLWPGLVQTLRYNLNRQLDRVRIFEYGLKYVLQHNDIKQNNYLACAICGPALPEQWGSQARECDFFDLKGDLEGLLDLTGRRDQFIFKSHPHPALHPGQSARIEHAGKEVGWIGALHPKVLQKLELNDNIYVFEICWDAISNTRLPEFEGLSKFPSIRRDLALVLDENTSCQELVDCIQRQLQGLLREIRVFDVYQGKGIDSGRKSIALGLILQETSRTLTVEDVELAMGRLMEQLEKELGATLRE